MTKCYSLYVEPFFTNQCCSKDCTPRNIRLLKKERKDMIAAGIKFDKSSEDVEKYRKFISSDAPRNKATENDEWYTPPEVVEAARVTMQTIDLDPASCDIAQQSVQATEFFTKEEDGLSKEWYGKVWMNPPFTMPARREFCERLVKSFTHGKVNEACVLINNVVFDQQHIQNLLDVADAICLVAGRLKFIHENGEKSKSPLWGQSVVYLGMNTEKFEQTFREFGVIFRKCQHGRD